MAAPVRPSDERAQFPLAERDLMLHWESIVRVLLDERDKDFMGELPGLPKLRIRTNLDEFAVDARVERYWFDARRGAFDIVTKKRRR